MRLYGIDAPELVQPYGQESPPAAGSLVRRGGIRMDAMATDRYGRTVGLLYRRRRRAQSVNVEMVRSGMAWWYRRYGGRETWGSRRRRPRPNGGDRGIWKDGDRIRRPLGLPGRPAPGAARTTAHPARSHLDVDWRVCHRGGRAGAWR